MGEEIRESLDNNEVLESMKDIIKLVPNQFYADILYESIAKTSIKKSHSGDVISIPHTRGYVFRIFNGKRYTEISDSNIMNLKKHVKNLVNTVNKYDNIDLCNLEPQKLNIEIPMKKNINEVALQDKIEKINTLTSIFEDIDPDLTNLIISYQDTLTKKIFCNTEGSMLRQVIPRARILLQPIVEVEGNYDFDFLLKSHEGGLEIIDSIGYDQISQLIKSSKDICVSKNPPNDKYTVILDPSLSGLIAHESIGHGLQADQFIRDRSFFIPHYKKKIGSDLVNISDSPCEKGVVGSYYFDDEGVIAQKSRLIVNGCLENLIHTRFSATLLKEKPLGNGRRESFLNPIYPRMSNTFFEPGNFSFEEMIEETKKGIYLLNGFYGKEDPLGGSIRCSARKAYLIEDGVLTTLFKGASISGEIIPFLQSISAVGKENVTFDGGICGKGIEDHIPITSGGVHIKAEKFNIGPA